MSRPMMGLTGPSEGESKWRCGRCLLIREECSCGWPFSFRDYGDGHPQAEETQ